MTTQWYSDSNWWAVIVAAASLITSSVSAFLAWKYTRESVASNKEMARAASEQARLAMEGLKHSDRLFQASIDQTESTIRPVLVLRSEGDRLQLLNLGVGTAFKIETWLWPVDSEGLPWPDAPHARRNFVEPKQSTLLEHFGEPRELLVNRTRVVSRYRSLSGRSYRTEGFAIDEKDTGRIRFENRFFIEEIDPAGDFTKPKQLSKTEDN